MKGVKKWEKVGNSGIYTSMSFDQIFLRVREWAKLRIIFYIAKSFYQNIF